VKLELIKSQLGLEQVEVLSPSNEAARTKSAEHVLLLENPTPFPWWTRSPFSSANRSLRLKHWAYVIANCIFLLLFFVGVKVMFAMSYLCVWRKPSFVYKLTPPVLSQIMWP
jgi:hypothetical protein